MVKIIVANIALVTGRKEQILSQIAPCYVRKYETAKIEKDIRQELLSGYLLKRYLGVSKDEQLTYHAYQKPFLASAERFFNLSHSDDYVVLAMAACNVGVDVERIRVCHEAAVKKVFSEKQREELLMLEGYQKDEMFTEMWTQCEAVLKLKGTGFSREWEMEKELAGCSLYTAKIEDYIISCATEKQVHVVIERLEDGGQL